MVVEKQQVNCAANTPCNVGVKAILTNVATLLAAITGVSPLPLNAPLAPLADLFPGTGSPAQQAVLAAATSPCTITPSTLPPDTFATVTCNLPSTPGSFGITITTVPETPPVQIVFTGYGPISAPYYVLDNTNIYGVVNGGGEPTFTLTREVQVNSLQAYYWNGGAGVSPAGLIGLTDSHGNAFGGPWQATAGATTWDYGFTTPLYLGPENGLITAFHSDTTHCSSNAQSGNNCFMRAAGWDMYGVCSPAFEYCYPGCVDWQTSHDHCGRCFNPCSATQTCVAGACTP